MVGTYGKMPGAEYLATVLLDVSTVIKWKGKAEGVISVPTHCALGGRELLGQENLFCLLLSLFLFFLLYRPIQGAAC